AGEALQGRLERPPPPLALRPEALLHPEPLGRGELEGQARDRLALGAAVLQGEEGLLADVARLGEGPLAQAAGPARAAGQAGGERRAPPRAPAQGAAELAGQAVEGGEALAGLDHGLGEGERAADGRRRLERPQGGAAWAVEVGEEELALLAEVGGDLRRSP